MNPEASYLRLIKRDPYLRPYEAVIKRRAKHFFLTEKRLTKGSKTLGQFSSGHEYFGLHFKDNMWVLREWAPNATAVYMVGDMTDWREKDEFKLLKNGNDGEWEIRLSSDKMAHGDFYRLRVHWHEGYGDRIPAWARYVVQDDDTLIFNARVWHPPDPYQWRNVDFKCKPDPPFIYEAHVGMAQDAETVGSWQEFTHNILPRIVKAGYNTLQLMAVPEHPYYGSFGYHVSSFFSASSRFGTPYDLKELIDTAHDCGLAVIMDLVHSHAVNNEVEGLSRFDGTLYQYFHDGSRGSHPAWDSRCFDFGKDQVLHFLLSNCRYWLDEYRFDGFRFDGITSMLYNHHGLGTAFTSYDPYFDESVDEDALVYLALANKVIHEVRPDAITIAEDISGMPGLAVPSEQGGIGFDFRLAMGVPDYWIKLTKDERDEDWHMSNLWYELVNRRGDEKTISYSESHDQALVGDQTLFFRLTGADIYDHMTISDENQVIDRAIALHKIIRLITLATAGYGYQNFMGNEFGHPEWIDFPREGNGWSYKYAKRQWHLVDDSNLKYGFLARFDKDMIALARRLDLLASSDVRLLFEHSFDKVIAFERSGLLFVFNFHPIISHVDYCFEVPHGRYKMIFDSDCAEYGGHARLTGDQLHTPVDAKNADGKTRYMISLYLPTRTAIILKKIL
ncbi:MAG: alpha amylase C-terminal domain-containing protein [Deltaproteobacteria bacterium]|nr:alpha amylase C-terminal domain-containing protein [Deltaproteobacteria bacterium]